MRKEGIGLLTGLTKLDEAIRGLRPANLILIGGRTSQGKSSLALGMALNVAKMYPVGFFSLEMSFGQLQPRALSNIANLSLHRISADNITVNEREILNEAMKELKTRQLFVDDIAATIYPNNLLETHKRYEKMPENSINVKIKQAVNLGCKLIVIDYLQLIHYGVWSGQEYLRLHGITWALKELTKTYQIPIILVSQLSRPDKDRYIDDKNPPPRLTDLRGSGDIEQDAYIVLLLHRPQHYETGKELDLFSDSIEDDVELIIAKNRDGATGTIKLKWYGSILSYRNLED